jgi:hypothetical protein
LISFDQCDFQTITKHKLSTGTYAAPISGFTSKYQTAEPDHQSLFAMSTPVGRGATQCSQKIKFNEAEPDNQSCSHAMSTPLGHGATQSGETIEYHEAELDEQSYSHATTTPLSHGATQSSEIKRNKHKLSTGTYAAPISGFTSKYQTAEPDHQSFFAMSTPVGRGATQCSQKIKFYEAEPDNQSCSHAMSTPLGHGATQSGETIESHEAELDEQSYSQVTSTPIDREQLKSITNSRQSEHNFLKLKA